MHIEGKVALITGASSGIGAALAHAMGRGGAREVLLVGRNEERLARAAEAVRRNGASARIYLCDLSTAEAVEGLAARILGEVGTPDILVNAAGQGRWRFLEETGPDDIVGDMTLPYFAAAWLTRLLLPGMLKRGSGHIVNVSSVASRMAWPGATLFIVGCRAMRGLSDALRADLHGSVIQITHYESGPVNSPYWSNNPGSDSRVPRIARLLVPTLTVDQAACAIVNGIRNNKRFVVAPRALQLVYLMHAAFPSVVQWLMTATGHRPPGRV